MCIEFVVAFVKACLTSLRIELVIIYIRGVKHDFPFMIKNDRKKLDMDSADPQNRSEWRGRLRGRLVKKPNPR